MTRPVVGVIANSHLIDNSYAIQGAGALNLRAVCDAADAVPMIVPADPSLMSIDELRAAGLLDPVEDALAAAMEVPGQAEGQDEADDEANDEADDEAAD